MKLDYKIEKKFDEYVAISNTYPTIIGVGDTEKDAVRELVNNIKAYKTYLKLYNK